jgi:hypothetical protein
VTGLVVGAVCFGWLTGFVIMGRREYRRVYAEKIDSWSRMYGVTVAKRAHRDALDSAIEMIYKWPFEMAFAVISWLLTSEHLLGVPDSETDPWLQDPTDALIKKLDRELRTAEYEEAKHGPLNKTISGETVAPCPCGYRTECHIHCGTGPAGCHAAMGRAQDVAERRGVRYAFHRAPLITYRQPEWVDPGGGEKIPKPGVRYDAP